MTTQARPLRIGIQLPEVEREVRWPEYLAMARAAERRLTAAASGSDEERAARAEVDRLREEYRRISNPATGGDG